MRQKVRREVLHLPIEERIRMFREEWAALLPTLKDRWASKITGSTYQAYRRNKRRALSAQLGVRGKLGG